MKKFWKNICLGALAITSTFGLSGCGKDKDDLSVDLDNDGFVSEWEKIFESMPVSERVTINNLVEISSLSDLKAISDSSEPKVYKLTKNIDCNGETLSINLGSSYLYGNNKVIKNFKLGDCITSEDGLGDQAAKGLFYNGVAVYDLRLFMGNQTFSIKEANTQYTISPFINVPAIENVTVKGKITIDRQYASTDLYSSLLASSIEGKRCDMSISNCHVIGDIYYSEVDSYSDVYIGGIAPKIWTRDLVYNSTADCDFKVDGCNMNVGGIAGLNEGFVSTVSTKGVIYTSYHSLGEGCVGGIVGINDATAEIKNAQTSIAINYTQNIELSGDHELDVGGISGLNNGVINYTTSDATINISNCDAKVYMGSIAGSGENAIYYNVIGRGSINATKCKKVFVADIAGHSKYGYFEKIIANTNIKVDNSEINSNVNLGLVTIFEDLNAGEDEYDIYNGEFAPNFKSVLIGGSANVYTKSALSSQEFRYNLGLRNEFKKFKKDQNGELIPVGGENANPEEDEEVEGEIQYVTETLTPYVYSNLYMLDSYTINKFKKVDGENIPEMDLKLTYAKDSSNSPMIVTNSSSVVLQLNFFLRNLGFNYVVGNNEIDISSFDISKFTFTLQKDACLERYFRYNQKDYNGDLSSFDKEFEKECSFDLSDEMFSYLNKLITSNLSSSYSPLLISREFATSVLREPVVEDEYIEEDEMEEGEEIEEDEPLEEENPPSSEEDNYTDSLTVERRFARNITQLLKLMRINASETFYSLDFNPIDYEGDMIYTAKYVRLYFSDSKYNYSLTFDITQMVADLENENEEELKDNFIVYLDYHRDVK